MNLQLQKSLPFLYTSRKSCHKWMNASEKKAEKRISDILFEIEMSADMPADGQLNCQQRNCSCNIQGQSYLDLLSKLFLMFSVVSLQSMRTVWSKDLLLTLNNISIAIPLLRHLQNTPWTFVLLILHAKMRCGLLVELVASKTNQ